MGWLVFWGICALLGVVLLMPLRVRFALTGRAWYVAVRYGCFRLVERGSDIPQRTRKKKRKRDKSPSQQEKEAVSAMDIPAVDESTEDISTEDEATEDIPTADDAAENIPTVGESEEDILTADESAEDIPTEDTSDADASEAAAPKKKGFFQKIKPTNLSEGIGFLSDVFATLPPPLRLLGQHLHLVQLRVELVIATEDAAKTAITYGAISGAAFTLLGQLQACFDVRAEQFSVRADFLAQQTSISVSGELRSTPFSLLSVLLGLVVRFLWRSWCRIRRQERAQKLEQRISDSATKAESLS